MYIYIHVFQAVHLSGGVFFQTPDSPLIYVPAPNPLYTYGIYLCVCVYIYIYIERDIHLYGTCPLVHTSVKLSTRVFFQRRRQSARRPPAARGLSVYLYVCLYIDLSIYLSLSLSLYIYMYIYRERER